MAFRMSRSALSRMTDPAERWEVAFTEREGGTFYQSSYTGHPYTPRRAEDVPRGALGPLEDVSGVENLDQILVIPWAVRPTGYGGRRVISPNSVLAIGTRAVALWTEKPEPGVKVVIPLEGIAAIEDVIVLLYGKLSFIPFADRLTIRYNTVSRQGLEPALLSLRKSLSGPIDHPVPGEPMRNELPFKWDNLFHSPAVRIEESTRAIYRFVTIHGRTRREAERVQLLALTPQELVYLCDPVEELQHYGEDSFLVPRSRLEHVSQTETGIEIRSNGVRLPLSMSPSLAETAVRWARA